MFCSCLRRRSPPPPQVKAQAQNGGDKDGEEEEASVQSTSPKFFESSGFWRLFAFTFDRHAKFMESLTNPKTQMCFLRRSAKLFIVRERDDEWWGGIEECRWWLQGSRWGGGGEQSLSLNSINETEFPPLKKWVDENARHPLFGWWWWWGCGWIALTTTSSWIPLLRRGRWMSSSNACAFSSLIIQTRASKLKDSVFCFHSDRSFLSFFYFLWRLFFCFTQVRPSPVFPVFPHLFTFYLPPGSVHHRLEPPSKSSFPCSFFRNTFSRCAFLVEFSNQGGDYLPSLHRTTTPRLHQFRFPKLCHPQIFREASPLTFILVVDLIHLLLSNLKPLNQI